MRRFEADPSDLRIFEESTLKQGSSRLISQLSSPCNSLTSETVELRSNTFRNKISLLAMNAGSTRKCLLRLAKFEFNFNSYFVSLLLSSIIDLSTSRPDQLLLSFSHIRIVYLIDLTRALTHFHSNLTSSINSLFSLPMSRTLFQQTQYISIFHSNNLSFSTPPILRAIFLTQ